MVLVVPDIGHNHGVPFSKPTMSGAETPPFRVDLWPNHAVDGHPPDYVTIAEGFGIAIAVADRLLKHPNPQPGRSDQDDMIAQLKSVDED